MCGRHDGSTLPTIHFQEEIYLVGVVGSAYPWVPWWVVELKDTHAMHTESSAHKS